MKMTNRFLVVAVTAVALSGCASMKGKKKNAGAGAAHRDLGRGA